MYLIGLADGVFPSYQAVIGTGQVMEEERRNFYVAVTRTLETLTLTVPRSVNGYLKSPSRFLEEMGLFHA